MGQRPTTWVCINMTLAYTVSQRSHAANLIVEMSFSPSSPLLAPQRSWTKNIDTTQGISAQTAAATACSDGTQRVECKDAASDDGMSLLPGKLCAE